MGETTENSDNINKETSIEEPSHIYKVQNKTKPIDNEDDVLSKRPWSNSSKEVEFKMPDGTLKKCWVMSVVDANGDTVCFGNTKDMKFITAMENSLDFIFKELESSKRAVDASIEIFKNFKR